MPSLLKRATATIREWGRTATKVFEGPPEAPKPIVFGTVEDIDGEAVVFEDVQEHGFTSEDGGAFFFVRYGDNLRALLAAHRLKRYSESTQADEPAEASFIDDGE